MGISPMYLGDTAPTGTFTLKTRSGTPLNLTGLLAGAFVLNITDPDTGINRVGGGSFTVTDATNGIVTYQWAAADTSVLGNFELTITVTFANGPETSYPPVAWNVIPL